MYTERTNSFSIRNVILQFLFVALLVFILLWLFPTKKDMKNATKGTSKDSTQVKIDNGDLSVLLDRIFNENLISMKESAQSYFTTERLPQKVGDSKKITLKEMLDKKIILPFKDKNGKQCDLNASYVQITKYDNEFIMKVNLKCGTEENYLLTYMGCYDYCSQTICEKKGTTPKVYKVEPKQETPTKTVETDYRKIYEYKKTTPGNVKYSDWSEWSTTYIKPSNTVEVEKKEDSKIEKYYTDWSEWSKTKIEGSNTVDVEKKEESKTEKYYTSWSNWSTDKVTASSTRQVETRKESKTTKYYTDWSNWSTDKVTASSTRQVDTKEESKTEKYYTDWSNWSTTKATASSTRQVDTKEETKSENYYTDWSNWSTTKATASSTRQVETKEESKSEKYYTDWSNWSTTKATASSTRQVETKEETKSENYYTDWSDWSTTYVKPTDTIEVQSKDVQYRKLIGYNVKVEDDLSKPITELKDVVVASTDIKSCSKYNLTSTVTGYKKEYIGTFKYTTAPKETSEYTYRKVGEYNWYCAGNCTAGTVLVYEKYQLVPQTTGSYSCANYSTEKSVYVAKQRVVVGYEKKETKEPVYEYYTKKNYRYRELKTKTTKTTYYRYRDLKTKTTKTTYYRYRDLKTKTIKTIYYRYRDLKTKTTKTTYYRYRDLKTIQADTLYYRYRDLKTRTIKTIYYRYRVLQSKVIKTTYYRYRTKIVTPGTVSIKWSTYNDQTLLKDGYSYTGNYKVEKITK